MKAYKQQQKIYQYVDFDGSIKECQILTFDRNKYVDIKDIATGEIKYLKSGYITSLPGQHLEYVDLLVYPYEIGQIQTQKLFEFEKKLERKIREYDFTDKYALYINGEYENFKYKYLVDRTYTLTFDKILHIIRNKIVTHEIDSVDIRVTSADFLSYENGILYYNRYSTNMLNQPSMRQVKRFAACFNKIDEVVRWTP